MSRSYGIGAALLLLGLGRTDGIDASHRRYRSIAPTVSLDGDDPVAVYRDLCAVVDKVIEHFEACGHALPPVTIQPMKPLTVI